MTENLVKCKACQKDIGKKVKKCVHCGTDQRSWFSRHKILTGIGFVIVLGVMVNLTGGGETSTNPNNNNEVSNNSNKNNKEEKTYGIGDEVSVGKMIYTINDKTTAKEVGPSILPEKASGEYVVVNVTLKNNGNEAVTVDTSLFKLKRGEKTYEANSMASMSANQKEDGSIQNAFFLQQVNPDLELNGFVVFDVSSEVANASDLQLEVRTGVFGTETEIINLK